jgi:hypothetical protein
VVCFVWLIRCARYPCCFSSVLADEIDYRVQLMDVIEALHGRMIDFWCSLYCVGRRNHFAYLYSALDPLP